MRSFPGASWKAVAAALGLALGAGAAERPEPARVVAEWRFAPAWFGSGLRHQAKGHGAALAGKPLPDDGFQAGVLGRSLAFDHGRHWVRVAHHAALSLTDDFTVEGVIRPATVEGFNTIAWKGDRSCRPERINYTVDIRDGRLELKSKDADGLWLVFATVDKVIVPGHWCHVCIAFRQGQVEMAVDGEPVAVRFSRDDQAAAAPMALLPNASDLIIGTGAAAGNLPAYPFTGQIQELRFYSGRHLPDQGTASAWQGARLKAALQDAAGHGALPASVRDLRSRAAARRSDPRALRPLAASAEALATEARAAAAARAAAEQAAADQARYRALFERTGRPFLLAPLPAARRLVRTPTFFKGLAFADSFRLAAARGEREGFQVLLAGPPGDGLAGVSITVSELVHANGQDRIPADAIGVGEIACVTSDTPDIPMPFAGAIPDPILDGTRTVDVPPAGFALVFVRIGVPVTAAPGRYTGAVRFDAGAAAMALDVELEVFDFILPAANSMPLVFCFFKDFYKAWYDLGELTSEQDARIDDFLLSYRLPPTNLYHGQDVYPAKEALLRERDRGCGLCTLRYAGSAGDDATAEAIADACRRTVDDLRAAGLEGNVYFYSFDEIVGQGLTRLADAQRLLPRVRQAVPGIRALQTSFPTPDVRDLFDAWCPLVSHFANPADLAVLRHVAATPGQEVWWYLADSPQAPMPNLFVGYPVFDGRVLMTLSYMYDVKGVLYWCINREWKVNTVEGERWPAVPWQPYLINASSGRKVSKHGMGNLVYPGPAGRIYPSLRLENLRDGIEDYEYLRLLERLVQQAEATGGRGRELARARALLRVPETVARAVDDYAADPAALLAYREKVARAIERLGATR